MKKTVSWIAIFILIWSMMSVPVAGKEDISVLVDGNPVVFDVPPMLIGGRTMVPLRAIFEAIGATVMWDDATKTVTAFNEAYIVKATIGNMTMNVNGEDKSIDVAPIVIDSRTLVPARFVAEAFACTVSWNADTFTVSITTSAIDYSTVEQKKSDNVQVMDDNVQVGVNNRTLTGDGSRNNPYSPSAGVPISYQEYSFKPIRQVAITCINEIRGATANALAYSENMFNDLPSYNREWRFFEFNVRYISSTGGSDDKLKGSDVIYYDLFYKTDGSAVSVADTAALSHKYEGNGVFDVSLYPGGSAKVVIGMLIDRDAGDLLLRIPSEAGETNTWISCTL